MDNNQQVTPDASTSNPTPSAPSSTTNSSSKRHPQNLPLIIIIGVLILIIIGIIIAIFIVNQNKSSQSLDDSDSNITPTYKTAIEIKKNLQSTFNENGDIDKLISSYQTFIDEAVSVKNYSLAVTLINYRTSDLVSFNYCSKAIPILQNTNLDNYTTDALAIFYSDAMSASLSCSNTNQYNEWKQQYTKIAEEF